MQKQNIYSLFDHLVDDEQSDIRTREVIHADTSLWVAELRAGKRLPAHYHTQGSEIYHVLKGEGTIDLGEQSDGAPVNWTQSIHLQPGDVLEVQPGVVHRLSGGTQDLQLIFITAPSHLSNDRFFINDEGA